VYSPPEDSFEPVLGGTTYPVLNLTGAPGGAFTVKAKLDHLGSEFDVDALFTTTSSGPAIDLALSGKIPALGISPDNGYSGGLLGGEVIELQMYGDAGTGSFGFNGYFRVQAGDLITAGYLKENDTIAMRSWLMSVNPSLPEDFDFASDFTATTHLGELGSIPEPATMGLLVLASGVLVAVRKRIRRK